ncbi:hypothetical protein CJ030_MR0G006830 [Morella rubra]|uniref:RNase H type-1 domain-containing protein n=1 Tax=Morella rubra TaxID=262757 RepID=A0A6A1UKY2_9ROSI|nr:hypothetical protein CJ030_MR0G006830 [Morella rubra]
MAAIKRETYPLLRDHNGNVLSWKVDKIPKTSPLEGEALTAKKGFEEACRKGLSSIILEGHSLNVIQAIKAYPKRVEWRIFEDIVDIHSLLHQFQQSKTSHVSRDANLVEHRLARWAASEFSSEGTPRYSEHISLLSWLFSGADPP